MTITVFGPDGSKRVLSEAEAEAYRAAYGPKTIGEDPKAWAKYYDEHIAKPRADKEFAKSMKKRGYIQPRTRATFGWRLRERRASAIRFEELNAAIPNADWDYAPVGEGTQFRLVPRTRVNNTEVLEVWAVHEHNSRSRRRLAIGITFYNSCGDGTCHKDSCALCFAVENETLGKHEIIKIERIPVRHLTVNDPATSGVHESGNRPQGPPVPTDEEKAPYSLTSTQKDYKKGSDTNKWR